MKRKKDGTKRWLDESQFRNKWTLRNARLLEMLRECDLSLSEMSFCEYGCGPKSPFSTLARGSFKSGSRLDIKAWDDEVVVLDLNDANAEIPSAEVGVLSGILEYLNDPATLLAKMRNKHEVLALSYMVLRPPRWPQHFWNPDSEMEACVQELRRRSFENGIRNHLTAYELRELVSAFGYIDNAAKFGAHVLLILRRNL